MPDDHRAAFPGRTVQTGSADRSSVRLVQERLNQVGCGPVAESGVFDRQTKASVQLFQARSLDLQGMPLVVDGKVGPLTWGALFGREALPAAGAAPGTLAAMAIEIAGQEVGIMEEPPGSNRGPRVDEYLRSVALDPAQGSFPWCAAFVYWCFQRASESLSQGNPVIRTAGVRDHWNRAGRQGISRILRKQAADDPSAVKPGQIFVMGFPGGLGHTGLVEQIADGRLVTIEGNTNEGGSRSGVGVFRRTARKISDVNLGFISY